MRDNKLPSDGEADLYIQSFIISSNRVRHSIIIITIASILLFAGHHNSAPDSWLNSRLNIAYLALHKQVWIHGPGQLTGKEEIARQWTVRRNLHTAEEIKSHIETLETARTEHLLQLQMPLFGISFDVNDLGFFGSIALSILMLMLAFSMSRQHENLYLALWRVKDVWAAEGGKEAASSQANLIYHTLAMSQQFSQPPSLARWNSHKLRNLSNLLIFLPVLVMSFCYYDDIATSAYGKIINPTSTIFSLFLQGAALLLVTALSCACFLYNWSNAKRWRQTFMKINPSYRGEPQPSWLEWVGVISPKRKYCEQNHVFALRPGRKATEGEAGKMEEPIAASL